MKVFQHASEWVTRLVWTNILWIGFTLLGLIIFGIMPATVALFTVTRKWTMKEFEFSIWKLFKETYFKEWKRSNKIGILFWLISLLLLFNLRVSVEMEGAFSLYLYIFFVFLILIFSMMLIFFFPLYAHYKFGAKQYVKQSFIYSLVSLKSTILILIGLFMIGYLMVKMPVLIVFSMGVLPAYWISTICMKRFGYLEKKFAAKA